MRTLFAKLYARGYLPIRNLRFDTPNTFKTKKTIRQNSRSGFCAGVYGVHPCLEVVLDERHNSPPFAKEGRRRCRLIPIRANGFVRTAPMATTTLSSMSGAKGRSATRPQLYSGPRLR